MEKSRIYLLWKEYGLYNYGGWWVEHISNHINKEPSKFSRHGGNFLDLEHFKKMWNKEIWESQIKMIITCDTQIT